MWRIVHFICLLIKNTVKTEWNIKSIKSLELWKSNLRAIFFFSEKTSEVLSGVITALLSVLNLLFCYLYFWSLFSVHIMCVCPGFSQLAGYVAWAPWGFPAVQITPLSHLAQTVILHQGWTLIHTISLLPKARTVIGTLQNTHTHSTAANSLARVS